MNELEINKLQELLNATHIFTEHEVPVAPEPTVARDSHDIYTVVGVNLERQVMCAVQMFQNLGTFDTLCENDRISLIKYGCFIMFCMRSLPAYDYSSDHWTYPIDNENSMILTLYQMFPYAYSMAFKRVFHSLSQELDSDPVVLDLLTAILLFNPDRPMLTHRELVKLQQNIYMYLLHRYILLKYRKKSESQQHKYSKLMKCLKDLNILGEKHLESIKRTDARSS
ncbi:unnamed protein product [Oppiella nova]|uniref:NR LBD domain-containing protein n=1 Tax=Oppiella nova TaxID=334625 RepID=A0A7R9MKT3_9ACAR|nr:unnamed protein product [Oppiella nova]CAG2179236.1 unnamed protein product [Oppiella nova]